MLQESEDRTRVWDRKDAQAHHMHRQIGELIAIDFQPFSIVEIVRFKRLVSSVSHKGQCHSGSTENS